MRISPDTAKKVFSREAAKMLQILSFWKKLVSQGSWCKEQPDCLPRCLLALTALPSQPGYRTAELRERVPEGGPTSLRLMAPFPPQVKDYAENAYYSNFISHLEDIRYAGKRNHQKVHQGGGLSLSEMGPGGQESNGGGGWQRSLPGDTSLPVQGLWLRLFPWLTQAVHTSERPVHKLPVDFHDWNVWMARVP